MIGLAAGSVDNGADIADTPNEVAVQILNLPVDSGKDWLFVMRLLDPVVAGTASTVPKIKWDRLR
jgi:hypothetical protein